MIVDPRLGIMCELCAEFQRRAQPQITCLDRRVGMRSGVDRTVDWPGMRFRILTFLAERSQITCLSKPSASKRLH